MRPATKGDYLTRISDSVATLADKIDEAPDLAELASEAGFSPWWFHRIFGLIVGETPGEFSRRLRLERAAWRLLNTNDSVGKISLEAGFSEQASFTRSFRSAFGKPPQAFRSAPEAGWRLSSSSGAHFDPDGAPQRLNRPLFTIAAMKAEAVELKDRPYAYVVHEGAYHKIGASFGRLGGIAGPAGLFGPGGEGVGVYFMGPEDAPEEELRSHAGVFLREGVNVPPGLERGVIPGGKYAKVLYVGPYSGIGQAWGQFCGDSCPQAGLTMSMDRPSFEVYLNDCSDTPEDKLQTELYVAIE